MLTQHDNGLRSFVTNTATATLSPMVGHYIVRQRNRLIHRALPLSEIERFNVASHFTAGILDRVRILVADPLPITQPPFSGALRSSRFDFPSVALTAAVTFDDVIACREPLTPLLLFHELVHVVPYQLLGVRKFAYRYVHGFLAEGSYREIPLECCAFELEQRFATDNRPFSVEAQVAEWIELRRL